MSSIARNNVRTAGDGATAMVFAHGFGCDQVGQYVQRRMAGSTPVQLRARGHCPHLSAPDETVAAMRDYLRAAA